MNKKPAGKLATSRKELAGKRIAKRSLRAKSRRTARTTRKEISAVKYEAAEKPTELSQAEANALAAKVEREKRFIMWSGVTFFMILIAFFWLYNTKQVLESHRLSPGDTTELFSDWNSLGQDISGAIAGLKEEINNNSTTTGSEASTTAAGSLPAAGEKASTTTALTQSTGSEATSTADVKALKERLEALENKLQNNE